MAWLIAASLLFAFSFGLIKGQLTDVDPVAVSAARLVLAAAAFAPMLGRVSLPRAVAVRALLLGMLQFGLMYVLYISSFARLPAYMVALFTIFTPLYVTLIADLQERRFQPRHLAGRPAGDRRRRVHRGARAARRRRLARGGRWCRVRTSASPWASWGSPGCGAGPGGTRPCCWPGCTRARPC